MNDKKEVDVLGLKCGVNENGVITAKLLPGDPLYEEFKSLFDGDIPVTSVRVYSSSTHKMYANLVLHIDLHVN